MMSALGGRTGRKLLKLKFPESPKETYFGNSIFVIPCDSASAKICTIVLALSFFLVRIPFSIEQMTGKHLTSTDVFFPIIYFAYEQGIPSMMCL